MRDKKFSLSRFSPSLQEMCRLPYHFEDFEDTTEPIDYINRFSLTDADIPDLLEIASLFAQDADMEDYEDAPFHAWMALALLDPLQVVPGMLDLLNRIDWDDSDFFDGADPHDGFFSMCLLLRANVPLTKPGKPETLHWTQYRFFWRQWQKKNGTRQLTLFWLTQCVI